MWDLLEIKNQYLTNGYSGPHRFLSVQQCQEFLQSINCENARAPLDWEKGYACSSRPFYEIATHSAILKVVSSILGNNVILWGCSLVTRHPGATHAWHSDIESIGGNTISVWIGIQNTTVDSTLQMIGRSHLFGRSIQEVRHNYGKGREQTTTEETLHWAQEFDAQCQLIQPAMTDGDALFFHGSLWHSSNNRSGETRKALLLQYATADTPIRIPDANQLDWPVRKLETPKPPCLLVMGRSDENTNRIVAAPVPLNTGNGAQLTSCVYPLRLPLAPDEATGWKPYPIFRGCTPNLQRLSCHVSVLNYNFCPHPPHTHREEEILLLLDGEVDLILPETEEVHIRLRPQEFVYYPSGFAHTLQTVSRQPATYLMLRWRNEWNVSEPPLRFGHFKMIDHVVNPPAKGLKFRIFFEGPTTHLSQLQCHGSQLAPGSGYPPHADAYDAAIILLDGEVETIGQRVAPHGVIFYSAGHFHGMHNPSNDKAARYLVFEFHGRSNDRRHAIQSSHSLLSKLTDPRRWIRKAKRIMKRVRNLV